VYNVAPIISGEAVSNLAVWILLCTVGFLLGASVFIAPARMLRVVARNAEGIDPRTVRTVRIFGAIAALLAIYQLLTVFRSHMY